MRQLAPRQQNFVNILINSLGSFISGILGSIIIIIITFIMSNYFNVVGMFGGDSLGLKISPIFPFIFSLITLLGLTVSSFMSYKILNMTDPEKYKKNSVLFGQLSFLQVICYVLMLPMYIYSSSNNFDSIMYIFAFHVILVVFGTNIILELFNNYRYILLGLYGSIIGLVFSILFCVLIFSTFSGGYSKMIILMTILPFSNFIIVFLKQSIEFLYSMYYKLTTLDPLGDIFYQIELEEEREMREEEEKNII